MRDHCRIREKTDAVGAAVRTTAASSVFIVISLLGLVFKWTVFIGNLAQSCPSQVHAENNVDYSTWDKSF